MTLDDDLAGGCPDVAIGPSPVAAGHAFGRDHDDVVLAAYGDLAELDLGAAASVAVLVAPGCQAAFARAAALLELPTAPRLESAAAVEHHDLLLALLDRHDLQVEGVRSRAAGGVSFVLSRRPGSRDQADDRRLLDAVAAATPLPSAAPRETPVRPPRSDQVRAESPDRAATRAARPRRTPPLVRAEELLARLVQGQRRTASLAGVGAAVLLVTLTVLAATGLGVLAGLVMVLGTVGLVTGLVLLVAVLMLARQVHRQTGRLESVLQQHHAQLRDIANGQVRRTEELSRHTDLTHDYLESIATAEALRGRDLHVALRALEESPDRTSPRRP